MLRSSRSNPAPVGSEVFLNLEEAFDQEISVTRLAIDGRALGHTKVIQANTTFAYLSVPNNLASGIYLLRLDHEQGYFTTFKMEVYRE